MRRRAAPHLFLSFLVTPPPPEGDKPARPQAIGPPMEPPITTKKRDKERRCILKNIHREEVMKLVVLIDLERKCFEWTN